MAHESFEDEEVAEILNRHFISIKVDKEERPDIDSIYMSVCQALTGSGGWPTSIFVTHEQKPFFAGTYFPKTSQHGMTGFVELLLTVRDKWENDRASLLKSCAEIIAAVTPRTDGARLQADPAALAEAVGIYKNSFDEKYGGFGSAPKFPAPHNLLFLLDRYAKDSDEKCLEMAETTLLQMYRGGLFDHIGFGFSRYSTDRYYLAPHFEKMLYDNALLMLVYCKAYWLTKKQLYLEIAEKTADYILREMTSPEGGFYSAQDADSDGEEGKYYVFTPGEITELLGEKTGRDFCRHFGISDRGNFEGKNIPNLLDSDMTRKEFDRYLPKIYDYRLSRCLLHLDDKILASWNSLMIAAMCSLYQMSRKPEYLQAARRAQKFIESRLRAGDELFVSCREGVRGESAFIDDYAHYIYALLALYDATLDADFITKARRLCVKTVEEFFDGEQGGFFLYGAGHEALITRPKETYDGAIPSGNSVMAHNLVRLIQLASDDELERISKKQMDFMFAQARRYPAGYAMFLLALSDNFSPPRQIVAVVTEPDAAMELVFTATPDSTVSVLEGETDEYPLKNGRTTYYVCRDKTCLPPVNDLSRMI